jgi:hypothetical protein
MTEPFTPGDRPIDTGNPEPAFEPTASPATAAPGATDGAAGAAESPTQAWPSLAGPPAGSPTAPSGAAEPFAATAAATTPSASPFEPAPSLPAARVGTVAEPSAAGAAAPGARRPGVRWALAIVGVLIVAAASFAIVSLVGGRPSASSAIGYMPSTTLTYSEVRLDLPGDQRAKLATFLKAFPGFADQSAIEPKLDDVFDRIVRAASQDKQTWTADIKPWFGGQVAVGMDAPDPAALGNVAGPAASGGLIVITISDRAKATAWLASLTDPASLNRSTYGDADLFVPAAVGSYAAAINDKVLIAGATTAVKAAIDTGGKGTLADNDDVKAALATIDKDYVMLSLVRTRAYADAIVKTIAVAQPGALDRTQIDETVLAMVPAWQATTARFENDAIVSTNVGPSWAIGADTANEPSDLLGHVPAKTILYAEMHDLGPALTALLGKFRALDEAKPVFAQVDQALNLLGGADAVYGWWGDTALVVSSLADGTIGGGLVIHPRDAAAADRLVTTLHGFLALGGASAGVTTRTEDHAGTKVTIVDLSAVPGMSTAGLPPYYKPELAWATNTDETVIGFGSTFVDEVLDAHAGSSLGDDARFKGLLDRVGASNIGVTFVDISAIRGLVEPLLQAQMPADDWTRYTTDIQPYLKPLDAMISGVRKDGDLVRGSGLITAR